MIIRRGLIGGLTLLASLAISLPGCGLLTASPQPGSVLFHDDFSDPATGWDRYRDAQYAAGYDRGEYRITVFSPDTHAWARPGLSFSNVWVEVDVTKVAGPDNNSFGVLCGYQDSSNFYFLLISSDGYAGIGTLQDGSRRMLTGDAMLPSPLGRLQGANHLRVGCLGDQLELNVNGTSVAQASAGELVKGDVGLFAGTYEQGNLEIVFDNFMVVEGTGS